MGGLGKFYHELTEILPALLPWRQIMNEQSPIIVELSAEFRRWFPQERGKNPTTVVNHDSDSPLIDNHFNQTTLLLLKLNFW